MKFVWTLWTISLAAAAVRLKGSELGNASSSSLTTSSPSRLTTPSERTSDGISPSFVVSTTAAATSDSSPPTVTFSSTTDGSSSTQSTPGFSTTTPSHRKINCDKYCCNCQEDRARCTGQQRNLTYLPQVPDNIRDFRMMSAQLGQLTRPMLANLSNFHIEVMNLTYNKIVHIAPDAFADFVNMTVLDLSGNPVTLTDLGSSLRGISSKIMRAVALWDMNLTDIPDDFFEPFSNMTFTYVDLHANRMQTFNSALLAPFWSVKKAELSSNQISTVNMSVRINVTGLVLTDNSLREFPDFCLPYSPDTGDVSGFYNLQSLKILSNPINQLTTLSGACLPRLTKLDISKLHLSELKNNFIADLPRLSQLLVTNMRLDHKDQIHFEPFAFNSSSLQTLKMVNNPVLNTGNVDVRNMFLHCPNLTTLTIINVKLDFKSHELFSLLSPLSSLENLSLQKISRGFLPANLLWRMPRLKTLQFTGNKMNQDTMAVALANVTSLMTLNVLDNRITLVNETVLPWEVRQNLTKLDISHNPFACTCDMRWFKSWLDAVHKNRSVDVHNYPNRQYICDSPANMKGKKLASLSLTEADCTERTESNPLLWIGIVGGSVLLVVLGVVVTAYKFRWYWRYYLYRCRRRRQYVQIPGGVVHDQSEVQFFQFDAYLAHSAQDLDWIMEELLPLLEGQRGLRVFLKERDGVPAMATNVSTTQRIDESARVLLLLSDAYIQEGRRLKAELDHILFAARDQHKDVIVVLLGDVEAGRMTKDMRRMLTRGTFLQWGDSHEAKEMFKTGLHLALKTQDVNLQGLC